MINRVGWVLLLVSLVEAGGMDSATRSFLNRHCVDCHDGDAAKGDVRLDSIEFSKPETAELWVRVLEQVQADLMPPFKKQRPPAAERRGFVRGVEQRLRAEGWGEAYFAKRRLPEYGNWVDHELLFSGEIKTAPFTPARLWRISPAIYAANHPKALANPYVFPTKESGLRDYAVSSAVDQSTVESIMVAVNQALDEEIFKARGGKKNRIDRRTGKPVVITVRANPRHRYAPFAGGAMPNAAQVRRLIREEFLGLLHREPEDKEVARYRGFFIANAREAGALEAMRATVLAIHVSPEAIYRSEIGKGPADAHGRRRLSADELVYVLGYALDHRHPLDEPILTEALASGRLETRAGIAETVRALLKRPDRMVGRGSADLHYDWSNARLLQFFREYFGYAGAPQVFKDLARRKAELGHRSPSTRLEHYIVRDLDNLIRWIVRRDRDVFRQLLTTDRFLVGHPGDNALMKERHGEYMAALKSGKYRGGRAGEAIVKAAQDSLSRGILPYESSSKLFAQVQLYDLPLGEGNRQEWSFALEQPVQLAHRRGVLTHPAWLWAHSTNFDTDPIHRGIWVYRRLLAGVLADVPPDVDARVPEDPHKTLRGRLDVIRADACWKCHRKINPLGETFEVFDDWGRHRTRFYFDQKGQLMTARDAAFKKARDAGKLVSRPIDATGRVFETGDPALDGEVKDAFDLLDRLARSDRVRQSFVRHAFRFFLGRNETLADSPSLIAADRAYQQSGGSFHELVVAIVTSDSFLYRK